MYFSVAQICNAALHRIGYETEIGYLYEGSTAARIGRLPGNLRRWRS